MVAKVLLLIVLAASGVACGADTSLLRIDSTDAKGQSSPVKECSSSPQEGVVLETVRQFERFDATLSPLESSFRPAFNGTVARSTAESLGMLPAENVECTEILLGQFADNTNGPTGLPAWAIIVHTTKPWTMDVAHYWKECALRGASCPTPSVTERIYSLQTVVVIDAVTKEFVRHMEIPQED